MIEVRVVERCELNVEDLSVESLFAHQSLHVKRFWQLSRNLEGIRDPVVILNRPLSVDGMPLHIVLVVHVQLLLALRVALKFVNRFNFDEGLSRDFSQVLEKVYFAAVVV
jgi:hypothetical protein